MKVMGFEDRMVTPSSRFAPAKVELRRREDGTIVMRSPQTLRPYPRCVTEWLVRYAEATPQRVFLAERAGSGWRRITYEDAYAGVRKIGQGLLDRGCRSDRPVAILSGNGIDHALLGLGAMHAGVPVAPVSPAYSLVSRDYGKLKHIFDLIQPGLVYVSDPSPFASALTAVGARPTPIEDLLGARAGAEVDSAFEQVGPDTIAKILFTSGSTGIPKGVINTHRMLCSNQEMLAQVWPFVEDRPPVTVDWLPWSHTFGGNHNFNMILRNGGTMYIDLGKPLPGLVQTTLENLRDVSPTIYFNVPRGYDLLLPHLENDAGLRQSLFRNLQVIFYAAAALPQSLWERIERLSLQEADGRVAMLSAWGATETSPLATSVHFAMDRSGVIGLPVPGCELKLVPSSGKLEVRVRGPNVTPGYYRRPDLNQSAFDDEGFYRTGDAVKFADADDASKGLLFDGRIAEDFKLSTGTWVHVGAVRLNLIAAADSLIQDAVITGHDRDEVGALVFLSPAASSLNAAEKRTRLSAVLSKLAHEPGSSTYPTRIIVLSEPPSIDANEITDKGYINQRAILERRAVAVDQLYGSADRVIFS